MFQDERSELFVVARQLDSEERGLPFSLEAIRLAQSDPQKALNLARMAKEEVPYAWGAWTDAFSYELWEQLRVSD